MPTYFEITSTDDVLTLQQGSGTAGFTVHYVGERPVEARARAVALEGADAGWLSVAEPAVKEMQSNQTQTFKVMVNVPPGTLPGRYGLRLDVMSVDNTDEEYNQGPLVIFQIPQTSEPKEQDQTKNNGKGFPWWIVIVVCVVLVLITGGLIWWFSNKSSVIDFSEQSAGFIDANAYLDDGVSLIEARLDAGYCPDAQPVILAKGRYKLPAPVLSTASPGNENKCNGVRLYFKLDESASSVAVNFYGANVSYVLNAYDRDGALVGSDSANSKPYDYENLSTVTVSSEEENIDYFEFGHQKALTLIHSIEIK